MRFLACSSFVAVAVAACTPMPQPEAPRHRPTTIAAGEHDRYLVDPNTESCTLIHHDGFGEPTTAIAVDCTKLARNVPNAAAAMVWLPASERPIIVSPAPAPPTAPAAKKPWEL